MHPIPTSEQQNSATPPGSALSRRNFLKSGSLIAAGLAFGLPWFGGCTKSRAEAEAIWNELSESLQGTLLRPDYSGFRQMAAPWALQYDNVLPRGIAQCISKDDVKACILWARKHQIPVIARSGGHSYGGYSTTTGLMIDVSPMSKVEYDGSTQLLKVEGGARNKHVFAAGNQHQVAITHGRCFEVGVSGLTLGGGIGFDMRMNGYTCDKLLETEVVLANGEIITCNESENSDLFWACRGGGGGNFGIHTSFVFKTFATGHITVFNLTWDQNIENVLEASQVMIAGAPDTLGLKLSIHAVKQSGNPVITLTVMGSFAGEKETLTQILNPMIAVQAPQTMMMEAKPYWEGQEILSEKGDPEYAHERSRFIKGYLDPSAIQTIINNLGSWPGTSKGVTWKFFLLGGAIDNKLPEEMAMVHRGYTMLSSIDLEWTTEDSSDTIAVNEAWLDNFHQQMAPFTSDHCYQNFIDPHEQDYLHAYYGQNLDRLTIVKNKYDPDNMFTYGQAIPL